MPGAMSRADLIQDLEGMLMDAANKFTEGADDTLIRCLDAAARDMGRVRPRTLAGTLTLVADQTNYTAPADFLRYKFSYWGYPERQQYKPWQTRFPGKLPEVHTVQGDSGLELMLMPAPTAQQITDLGSTYRFLYFAAHQVGDTAATTTVQPGDRHLLLIRAVAEALFHLANNSITKPVQLGPGVGSMPKNGTPAALAEQYLQAFERMAA